MSPRIDAANRIGRWATPLVLLVVATAACGTSTPSRDDDRSADRDDTPPAPVVTRIEARTVGPLRFREYEGALASDPRLGARIDDLAALVAPTVERAEERAGVTFIEGRGALVLLADGDVPPSGEVTTRLLDGVRRPVVRVPASRLVSGDFVPEAHFPPLVVEAAVLAVAGERIAPAWLRSGLATEIGGSFQRVLHERVLGGPVVRTRANALFPQTPSGDDPLVAAVRVRALARIARGDRALPRFVAARLAGAGNDDALSEVGVHDEAFLEAAAETERDRALGSVEPVGPLRLLSDARDALVAGEASRGIPIAGLLEKQVDEGEAGAFVAADARIVVADYHFRAGDTAKARAHLVAALADPARVVRLREARLLEARIAREMGESAEAVRLYRAYAKDYPGAEGADEALLAVGIDPALGARLPGIADELVSEDAALRKRAAKRLGETGEQAAVEPLRRLAGDDDPDVRRVALSGLSLLQGEDAAAQLELATYDTVPDVRAAALGMLAFADAARGEARAREMEGDDSPVVRAVVDRVLQPTRDRERLQSERLEAERREAERRRESERRAAEEELRRQRDAAEARERAAEAAREEAADVPPPGPRDRPPPPPPGPGPDPRKDPLPPPKPPRPLPAPDDGAPPATEGGSRDG